jgi:8-amino-7-oxononanoate synthase
LIKNNFENSLINLKKRNLFREREIFENHLLDFASNDYLGFSENRELLQQTYEILLKEKFHSPKASILVNGYHQIHKNFEDKLKNLNNFESGIIVGSGFLANFGMIESLVRSKDILLIDEQYHASGMVATKLLRKNQVEIFKHNSIDDLERLIKKYKNRQIIIAVEGIYSMEGTLLKKEFFDIADNYNAILIVDEAHSFGVVGKNLLGVFDLYNIKPKENHIKMGTLGKALGSYGAYILGSSHLISYLENRAKPIIYSTAPSLFDTLLGHVSLEYLETKNLEIQKEIIIRQKLTFEFFNENITSLIFPFKLKNSDEVLKAKKFLKHRGFIVGGIRPPTVKQPLLRIILRINNSIQNLQNLFNIIKRREWS